MPRRLALLTPARRRGALVVALVCGIAVLTLSFVGLANIGALLTRVSRAFPDDIAQIGAEEGATPVAAPAVPAAGAAHGDATSAPGPGNIVASPAQALPGESTGANAVAPGAGGEGAGSEPVRTAASENGGAAGGDTGGTGGTGGASSGPNLAAQLAAIAQTTSLMCGPNTCNVGQVCCNWSCGVCTPPGGTCNQEQCANVARPPTNYRCGSTLCNDGQVCCNASCGICAAPGVPCSTASCP